MRRQSRPLVSLLQGFVDSRRGLRMGSLFGAPAVFAGRRAAIRLHGDTIDVRLTPAGRDFARALLRKRVLASPAGWLRLAPPSTSEAASCPYVAVFERAVTDVASA